MTPRTQFIEQPTAFSIIAAIHRRADAYLRSKSREHFEEWKEADWNAWQEIAKVIRRIAVPASSMEATEVPCRRISIQDRRIREARRRSWNDGGHYDSGDNGD